MSDRFIKQLLIAGGAVVLISAVIISIPALFAFTLESEQKSSVPFDEFPVTVNPKEKKIVENTEVNEFLESSASPLSAAVASAGDFASAALAWLAVYISATPWYEMLASAGTGERLVLIRPGMRKEQVANAFGKALKWDSEEKKAFLTALPGAGLPLAEGSFAAGAYSMPVDSTPATAQALINARFTEKVLSRYGTTTASMVPLEQALTVASLIQREAGGDGDMRLISGIIWNRLFINMNLQIDATLQYVKATKATTRSWWPAVAPGDQFRKSPYNTYLNPGLPPTPIASPSVAAILAALNPKETSCIFYFHDDSGRFHCSETYAGHVALLKQYFGRGK
ncbi:endolytic transglycosylase MltG [Candidatus Kaiserbacteria bacterium]|nr:endolytic transglycosylase MltG [Candidatus Kaiserbacteria bacterium]